MTHLTSVIASACPPCLSLLPGTHSVSVFTLFQVPLPPCPLPCIQPPGTVQAYLAQPRETPRAHWVLTLAFGNGTSQVLPLAANPRVSGRRPSAAYRAHRRPHSQQNPEFGPLSSPTACVPRRGGTLYTTMLTAKPGGHFPAPVPLLACSCPPDPQALPPQLFA